MALSTEIILTLQQLEGIGNKTILKIGEQSNGLISSIGDLCSFWKELKGKKFEKYNDVDFQAAHSKALNLIDECAQGGVGVISYYDSVYPDILKKCSDEKGKLDPPIILYYRGDLNALKKNSIAVIGTREPTPNGLWAGTYFASEFAKRGYNIVSGLAIGCDSAGHKGAIQARGTTTAILANGLDWDSVYPKENLSLAKDIVSNGGLLLSEYPVGQNCDRYKLVARDRLQAGLSYATVVIQTGISGGTMHAVNATRKSGKPVLAVVYNSNIDIQNEKSQGNTMLINSGAYPLKSKELDIAEKIIQSSIKAFIESTKSKHPL